MDWAFEATAGLPEEILLQILLELPPSARAPLSGVCSTWQKLVEKSWDTPWGTIKHDLGFHVLVPSRILRQSIPHVVWRITDFQRLPRGVSLISPEFTIRDFTTSSGRKVRWRLRLTRTALGQSKSEPDDLTVQIEAVNPKELGDKGERFVVFCRLDNPASYSWGHNETKKVTLSRENPSVKLLSHIHQVIADPNKGFLQPPDFEAVHILASVLPEEQEYVTIFSLADVVRNEGTDLLVPSSSTPVVAMPHKWNAISQHASQQALLQQYTRINPSCDKYNLQFWRVVMRRNNTFRPISNELKSYEEPFYAVFAHHVRESERTKSCLFVKYFNGQRLRFLREVFIDRDQSFEDLLRDLGKPLDRYTFFEEVHSRRVDPIFDLSRSLRSYDIGDGDIVVLVAHEHAALVAPYYQKIVYTSPLVTVSPNMWHS